MALTNVFQVWLAEQNEKNKKGVETGIRKFRELVRVENANKVIVFDDERYAIFEAYEVIILCGRAVLKPDMAVSCQEKKVPRPSGFEG
jgi:hypothetical protein